MIQYVFIIINTGFHDFLPMQFYYMVPVM